ncbi:acyl carrier protein [Streptomyces roseoverticillatus]|uniref:acyl carrier protein n=1 Tax=Streptomyces roseoverticillatus TaxID=66429 RepID=UPI0004BF40F8|nr:acyl carrier protein [Streptomyces roseoverticillatus]
MSTFTLDDLRTMLREGAGVDDSVDLDVPILDIPFSSLGYDSLAMLEIAARIEQQLGVHVPDELVERLTTPRAVLEYVGRHLAEVA